MFRKTGFASGSRILSAVLVVSLAFVGATQGVQADEPILSRVDLPDGLAEQIFTSYSVIGVTQLEAEALFGSAIAAVYFPERGEVHLLANDGLRTAREWLTRQTVGGQHGSGSPAPAALNLERKVSSSTSVSLRGFLASLPSGEKKMGGFTDEPFIVKSPTYKSNASLPAFSEPLERLPVVKGLKDSYIFEDFEGDVWSNWSRSDNSGGQYTWGIQSCDSYSGSYSADAARGGSQGSTLGCSTPYPESLWFYMSSEACQTVPPHWEATLEFKFSAAIDQDGGDSFGVFAEDAGGDLWGWLFWGNWSDGWYTLVFNMRQWYGIGDLGANYCNTLYLGFESDSLSNSGFGARVDDLYVWFGDSVGSSNCEILADPESGSSPLTVSFQASTDISGARYFWNFGDSDTSEEMDPVHVYTSPGTYDVSLATYDSYGTDCLSSTTIVASQATCTYAISPTSVNYGASGSSGSFSVTTQAGCAWSATSNNSWIHVTGGASGTGNGTVNYSVDANGGSSSRTGMITAAGRTFTITQAPAPSCTYSISPTSRAFDQNGGTGTVSVSTTAGCNWSTTANSAWIQITSGASGTGSGTVGYRVDANPGGARTGSMTIADHPFTVIQSGGGGGETYTYQVAGVAHAGGAGGSAWRSTLCVTNRSGSAADLTVVYRMGSGTVTRTHMLQNHWIKEWTDVAVSLFNQSGNTSGSIEITSSVPVIVVARTYNEAPEGTFGQGMPGNDDLQTLATGQLGVLPQLKKTAAFRTNVGLMNHGSAACNVRIKLFSETGSQIGGTINTSVPAKKWKQINDVFNEAGVGQCQIGYATIEVVTAGGKIWAYGSVVDNGTGDPTTIPLFIQ